MSNTGTNRVSEGEQKTGYLKKKKVSEIVKEHWLTHWRGEALTDQSSSKVNTKKDTSHIKIKLLQTNDDYKILREVREKETLHTREKQYE